MNDALGSKLELFVDWTPLLIDMHCSCNTDSATNSCIDISREFGHTAYITNGLLYWEARHAWRISKHIDKKNYCARNNISTIYDLLPLIHGHPMEDIGMHSMT